MNLPDDCNLFYLLIERKQKNRDIHVAFRFYENNVEWKFLEE